MVRSVGLCRSLLKGGDAVMLLLCQCRARAGAQLLPHSTPTHALTGGKKKKKAFICKKFHPLKKQKRKGPGKMRLCSLRAVARRQPVAPRAALLFALLELP